MLDRVQKFIKLRKIPASEATCLQFCAMSGIHHLESTRFQDTIVYQTHLHESGTVVIAQKTFPSYVPVACEVRVLV